MPKLFYRYGTCASGKSDALLGAYYTYRFQCKNILLLKPGLDTRTTEIKSRSGKSAEADYIINDMKDMEKVSQIIDMQTDLFAIFVDECQFLEPLAIPILKKWSLKYPVMCYGLRTDYKMNLFPAISVLMAYADVIEEIKSVCAVIDCKRKSFMNLKFSFRKRCRSICTS